MSVTAIRPADVLGVVTGNPVSNAEALGGVAVAQSKVRTWAEKVGTVVGPSLGAGVFDALAKGAKTGQTKKEEAVAQQVTGFSLSGLKGAAVAVVVGVIALGVWLGRRTR